jgi:MFS family permease
VLSYSEEFRRNWKPLLGASVAVSTGISLNFFTLGIFGPRLIEDLHWTKAQFALIGSLSIFSVFVLPIAGTMVDRFGTRRTAAVGFTAVPLGFVALSMMGGNIYQFLGINLLMSWLGLLTSGLVFCRVIIDRFDKARGIALALMMSAAPAGGAIVPLLIAPVIDAQGWRSAYLILALLSAIGGILAIALVGPTSKSGRATSDDDKEPRIGMLTRLKTIVRDPVFTLLMAGMFLVNMPRTFTTSQLKIAVVDYGFADAIGTSVVSVYAIGTIFGRCVSGLALDRLPTHLVAMTMLAVAALGYAYFLYPLPSTSLLMTAVFLMGIAFGCEFDVGAYLISRNFPVSDFSKLYATMDIALGAGAAVGSLLLSLLLKDGASYQGFMAIATGGTLLGAVLLGLIGRYHRQPDATLSR